MKKANQPLLIWRPSAISRVTRFFLFVIFGLASIYFTWARFFAATHNNPYIDTSLFLSYGLFILNALYSVVSSPEIVVQSDGFTAKYFWSEKFVSWEDVISVEKGTFQTYIYSFKLPKISYLIGVAAFHLSPAIMLGAWSENYDLTLKVICENVSEKCK